jgi:hypothetical protein
VIVHLLRIEPSPPSLGDNAWTVLVSDRNGQPARDVSIEVRPTMPAHGHGTPVAPRVVSGEARGEYRVFPLHLFMPGLWEIRFEIAHADGGVVNAIFEAIVPD